MASHAGSRIARISKVLVANRGEIAVRVIRAARDAGLPSVAVYAEPDAESPHVRLADEAFALGGQTSAESYLDFAKILDAAAKSGANAIHPGYGFLAENADFAQAVIDAGLIWIGPSPQSIRDLGDKVTARHIAARAQAPLVPGTPDPVKGADEVVAFAEEYGLPIAIKAAHGGGGKGMKVARTIDEIPELYESAVREATAAFGRGECYVERYLDKPRHVEAQVIADQHGNVVVAAGATETPGLLRRSGLGGHPRLGHNLALHPATMLAGLFDDDVFAWRGVLQSAAVHEFHESDGVLIEATSTPPGMGSMVFPGYGAELLRWLDRAPQIATFGAMVADRGVGTVRSVRGETVVRYDIAPGEIAKLRVALQAIGRLLFAAGAVEVLTGIPGAPPMRSLPELQDVLRRANPRSLHLAAFHPTGTAAAGADEQLCPVDATGRLRGVEGVWVADASILPSCPEVNPQLSIMAMALAVADQTVAKVVGVR
ncbi:hypothetical protein GR255_08905 [Mycobacterium tuberculosis]|nr:hypothetical protein [Mycobacterium tuberculosis]